VSGRWTGAATCPDGTLVELTQVLIGDTGATELYGQGIA
jgi:hypothetical protein